MSSLECPPRPEAADSFSGLRRWCVPVPKFANPFQDCRARREPAQWMLRWSVPATKAAWRSNLAELVFLTETREINPAVARMLLSELHCGLLEQFRLTRIRVLFSCGVVPPLLVCERYSMDAFPLRCLRLHVETWPGF